MGQVIHEAVSHGDILRAVESLAATIGNERHDDTGHLKSTGLFARLKSVEDRVGGVERERDRWRRDIVVSTAVIAAMMGFMMWLSGDRVENVQKLVRTPVAVETGK